MIDGPGIKRRIDVVLVNAASIVVEEGDRECVSPVARAVCLCMLCDGEDGPVEAFDELAGSLANLAVYMWSRNDDGSPDRRALYAASKALATAAEATELYRSHRRAGGA